LAPRDVTPEATGEVIEREVPGLAEALRAAGREKIPTAILSRGLAGACGTTLVVNLPGSPGGVRDGVAVLGPVVGHAIAQLRGEAGHGGDRGARSGERPAGPRCCTTARSRSGRCDCGTGQPGSTCGCVTPTGWRRGRPPRRGSPTCGSPGRSGRRW